MGLGRAEPSSPRGLTKACHIARKTCGRSTAYADYIMASGHSGRIVTEASLQAKTGRIHDRTRTLRRIVRFLLHRGHRPYMTLSDTSLP